MKYLVAGVFNTLYWIGMGVFAVLVTIGYFIWALRWRPVLLRFWWELTKEKFYSTPDGVDHPGTGSFIEWLEREAKKNNW